MSARHRRTPPARVLPYPGGLGAAGLVTSGLLVVVADLRAGALLDTRSAVAAAGLVVMLGYGLTFVLAAVTVAGFLSGAGAALVVAVRPGALPIVLVVAGALGVACGRSPAWSRVERRAATQSRWRGDRAVAALLVLTFPSAFALGSLAFLHWTSARGV